MYSFPRCHTQSKRQAVAFQIALILSAWHSCISLRRTMWFHASSFNTSIMTPAWSARVPTQGPLASESCFLLVSFVLSGLAAGWSFSLRWGLACRHPFGPVGLCWGRSFHVVSVSVLTSFVFRDAC